MPTNEKTSPDAEFNGANYPAKGHPWADFLHHRARVLVMWRDEGRSPEHSAASMAMDPGQVRLILATFDEGKVF